MHVPLLALLAAVPACCAPLSVSRGGLTHIVDVQGVRRSAVRSALSDSLQWRSRLDKLLDSLGCFGRTWDTLTGDTVVLRGGLRTVLDTMAVQCDGGDTGICVPPALVFPRPYDAGEIDAMVRGALLGLAEHGYARATARLGLEPRADTNSSAPHVAALVTIETGRQCCFGPPRIAGTTVTKQRQLLRDIRVVQGAVYDARVMREASERLESRPYIDSVVVGSLASVGGAADTAACVPVAVSVEVADRRGLLVDGALGFEQTPGGESVLSGTLDLSLLNVAGYGEQLSVAYRGEQDLQRLSVRLAKAHIGSVPVEAAGSFLLEIAADSYACLSGMLEGLFEIGGTWLAGASVHASENTLSDTAGGSRTWHVYGGDMLLRTRPTRPARGVFARRLSVTAGVDLARRGDSSRTRWRVEFSAGAHVPLFSRFALDASVVSRNLFADEEVLTPAELYRVGGQATVRGYPEELWAVRNAEYARIEYIVYIGRQLAVYGLTDGGVVSREGFERSGIWQGLLGYGVGTRIPVRIGTTALEWARSIDDRQSWGRVHVRFSSALTGAR